MRYWLLIMLFIQSYALFGQLDNYLRHNFTVDDGLPSNECYAIQEDSLGYIWIASDRGLSRFDGYEFKNYGLEDGLTSLSCLNIELDVEQNIWIQLYGGSFNVLYRESDSIISYEYNDILKGETEDFRTFGFNIDPKGKLTVARGYQGILEIDREGKNKRHYFESNEKHIVFPYLTEKGCLLAQDRIDKKGMMINENIGWPYPMTLFSPSKQKYYDFKIPLSAMNIAYCHCIGESIIVSTQNIMMWIEPNKPITHQRRIGIQDIEIFPNNQILASHQNNTGLQLFDNIEQLRLNQPSEQLLSIPTTRIHSLDSNSFWVGSSDAGVFYYKKSLSKIGKDYLKEEVINSIEIKHDTLLFIESESNNIYFTNLNTNQSKLIHKHDCEIFNIWYDETRDNLLVLSHASVYLDSHNYIYGINCIEDERNTPLFGRSIIPLSSDSFIWNTKSSFLTTNQYFSPIVFDDKIHSDGVIVFSVLAIGADKYLIGSLDALFSYSQDSFISLDKHHPSFEGRISDIKRLNDFIVLSNLGKGLAIWRSFDSIEVITEKEGLISNKIEKLIIHKNRIYALSKQGLSIIQWNGHNNYLITNLTKQHGLPSNVVTDIEFISDGRVVIATEKGIVYYENKPKVLPPVRPIFEDILVNQISTTERVFDHTRNNLMILYKSLNIPLLGEIGYRYRIIGTEWNYTKETSAFFVNLVPGYYKFEVQASNEDGEWSESMAYSFTINPPWHQTWWFRVFAIGSILFIGYSIVKNRFKQIRHESMVKEEISNLERSALQAQMEPHFIFNCLNSIQNYIMKNDKESAMEYLSRFAHLVRQTLNASVGSTITLKDEVSMLENYLKLEQLRFKNGFKYRIIVSDDINANNISIPPLLIQPFVENSVLHGMTNNHEDGLIEVEFSSSNDFLEVSIKDNGKGEKSNIKKTNKSLGMDITSKRLKHINNSTSEKYQISRNSGPQGTHVVVKIKLKQ